MTTGIRRSRAGLLAQPKRREERLSAMTRLRGLLPSIGLVAGLTIAPPARVAARDCAMTDLAQAIRDAEVAFVGRLAGSDQPVALPMPIVVLLVAAAALGVISVVAFRRGAR